MNLEYRFEELHLLPDPAKPALAIGYIDGLADIDIVHGGYVIADVWCSNTAEHGEGLVLIDRHSPLFVLLAASLRFQFDSAIRDEIAEQADQARDDAAGSRSKREYARV